MVIRLKWGQTEYKGTLESIDSYMNVLLRDTEEFIDGKNTGSLGLVLIRYVSLFGVGLILAADGMVDGRLLTDTGATISSGWARRMVLR